MGNQAHAIQYLDTLFDSIAFADALGAKIDAKRFLSESDDIRHAFYTLIETASALADKIEFRIDDPRSALLDELRAALAAVKVKGE